LSSLEATALELFVRFSDDRWRFLLLIVILFVLVIVVVRVLRRKAHDSDKAQLD